MSVDRDVEKMYSVTEFVAKLRRLADALENDTPFSVQVDGEKIAVPRDAILSVEHEREDGNEELEFQLSWKHEVAEADEDGDGQDEDEADPADEAETAEDVQKSATAA